MTNTDYYDASRVEEFINEEKDVITAHRVRVGGDDEWYGLALSGGGIRSAIFCLGALQALAAKNILPSFDYMSSVSGGGYIASALQWLWHKVPGSGADEKTFPFGASKNYRGGVKVQDDRLAYLRAHGQYLIPDENLSVWSLSGVILRTLFLNLSVWLPLGALAFTVLTLTFSLLESPAFPNPLSFAIDAIWLSESKDPHVWPLQLFFAFCIYVAGLWTFGFALWGIAFSLDTKISPKPARTPNDGRRRGYGVLSLVSGLTFAAAVVFVVYTKGVKDPHISGPHVLAIAILVFACSLISGLLYKLQEPGRLTSANYRWRRAFEIYAGRSLPWITILFALGTVPLLPYVLLNKASLAAKAATALISVGSGLFAAVFGHRAQTDQTAPNDLTRWVLMAASAVFIYSIGVVAYSIAQLWIEPGVLFETWESPWKNLVRAVIAVSVVVALIMLWGTNTNYVGLHRFYRDRLMEAFLPDPTAVAKNEIDVSPEADRISMADLWPTKVAAACITKCRVPYPLINTNGIFINDKNRLIAWRGGDNFILSPAFVGSKATGWERTARHAKKHGPLTLPSAMAASGAAMNANAAYVGAGVTRDRLVSIVLMLLNVRLGMWIAKPDSEEKSIRREPNHWSPSFRYGMTRAGYTSDSPFVELSDGGHFDNSGIYELARRGCTFIVAVDGEEDSSLALPALYSVAQRVREDFDAHIGLDGVLDELIPEKGTGYPEGASFVARPYFVAPITYKAGPPGVLVYVKLSLIQGLGFDALGYRAQHVDFPHQPTADQFFVPEQVEAYRIVGYSNMMKAIEELQLKDGKTAATNVLDEYRKRQKKVAPSP